MVIWPRLWTFAFLSFIALLGNVENEPAILPPSKNTPPTKDVANVAWHSDRHLGREQSR